MKLSFRVLWGVAALSVLAATAPAYASRPVYWRHHPWEDLVGHSGSTKAGNFTISIIKDHTKPCAPNRSKLNTFKLTGRRAYQWMISRGLAVKNPRTGGLVKTKTYHDWAFSRKAYKTNPNYGLYWQQACLGTHLRSGCGDLYTDAQRRDLIKRFLDPKFAKWKKSVVSRRSYDIYAGLRARMLDPNYHPKWHYQANVEIWKRKVNCMNRCIMQAPKDFQTTAAVSVPRFNRCMARCKAIKYKQCP